MKKKTFGTYLKRILLALIFVIIISLVGIFAFDRYESSNSIFENEFSNEYWDMLEGFSRYDELKAEEEGEGEEAPEEMETEEDEESEDIDISDFEESLFNDLGQKYLTEVYNNIESFNTSKVYQDNKNNKLIIEGVIKFNSGNTKKTSFIFEAKDIDKDRKVRFVGENQQITKGKKSFTLRGTLKDGNLLSESLTYNYRTRDNDGESIRLYNTIKVGK